MLIFGNILPPEYDPDPHSLCTYRSESKRDLPSWALNPGQYPCKFIKYGIIKIFKWVFARQPKMVDAVIANQTHVVVGEETETMQSADADNPKKGGHVEDNVTSGLQAVESSSPPPPPSPPSQKEDGGGGSWSPLLVKSSLIATGNRFSSRQLDLGSDWTPAGRPSLKRRD